jgi:hypothetical protein
MAHGWSRTSSTWKPRHAEAPTDNPRGAGSAGVHRPGGLGRAGAQLLPEDVAAGRGEHVDLDAVHRAGHAGALELGPQHILLVLDQDELLLLAAAFIGVFFAMSLGVLAAMAVGWGWVSVGLLIYSNAYLYRIHRVTYGRGRFSSVLRTLTLDFLYFIMLSIGLGIAFALGAMSI